MYQISVHVPESHLEQVKNAMFANGAGKIGNYQACAWQVLGEGQFMPLEGSHAFIGNINQIEKVPEYKVELICDAAHIQSVIQALKEAHPYETPSYQVIHLEKF